MKDDNPPGPKLEAPMHRLIDQFYAGDSDDKILGRLRRLGYAEVDAQRMMAEAERIFEMMPESAQQLKESHGSSFGKLALALSVTMVALSALLLGESFLLLDLPAWLFWILFYGIPVGCLVAICISIMALRTGETSGKYPIIALAMSAMVFAAFAFWHLLGLGLGAVYLPCLVDASALALSVTFLVILLKRDSGH